MAQSFQWCYLLGQICSIDMLNSLCSGMLQPIKRRNANWIGHTLRRNFFLKYVVKGKIDGTKEVTGRRGRGRKQLLGDFMEKRGYWKLKEETLDRTIWGTRFGIEKLE